MSQGNYAHRINVDELEYTNLERLDQTNPERPVAIPRGCQACGSDARYGRAIESGGKIVMIWGCSPCWQMAGPWRQRVKIS